MPAAQKPKVIRKKITAPKPDHVESNSQKPASKIASTPEKIVKNIKKEPSKAVKISSNTDMISKNIKKEQSEEVTAAEKKDAIKLLYTSRRAYKLIRREQWMHFPSLSSVRRFMQDIKFSPGLNESLISCE